MVANTDVTLVNRSNSRTFLFRGVSFKHRKTQPSIDIPLINTASINRILFKFTGQKRDIQFTFALFDDDTDVSSGTGLAYFPSGVKTVTQQIQWLMDYVLGAGYNVDYYISQARHFTTPPIGLVEDVDIDDKAGSGQVVQGTLTFKEGRIGYT